MDYYTRYPDKLDSAYCSSCLTIKPIADFKRRATLSQSRNWTKNPNLKRALEYDGKLCNACHQRRKPSDLSPEELRKRMVNEGKNPLKTDALVAERYAKGKESRRQKQTKARAQKYATAYGCLLTDVSQKLRKASEHLRYAKKAGKPQDYIENLVNKTHELRTHRTQLKEASRKGLDPTSLGNVTQNPAVLLSTSKGESQ